MVVKKSWFVFSIIINVILLITTLYIGEIVPCFIKMVQSIQQEEITEPQAVDETIVLKSPYYQYKRSCYSNFEHVKNEIIFLGDSITDNYLWDEAYPAYNVINRGIGGDTTYGILHRIHDITAHYPDKIFLMVGINDINMGVSNEKILENYKNIIDIISAESSETKIYIQSVLPCRFENQERINSLNEELSKIKNTEYIDLNTHFKDESGLLSMEYALDAVHINSAGYKLWSELIREYVEQS